MSRFTKTFALLALLACAACASGSPQAGTAGRARGSSTLITQQEVQGSPGTNAHEVVQFLRPNWLQKRGTVGMGAEGSVVVYLDGARLGGPEALRQVEKAVIQSLRYYDAINAQARFGMDHPYGAIQIVTERS